MYSPSSARSEVPSPVSLKSSQRIIFVPAKYADTTSLGFCIHFWMGKETMNKLWHRKYHQYFVFKMTYGKGISLVLFLIQIHRFHIHTQHSALFMKQTISRYFLLLSRLCSSEQWVWSFPSAKCWWGHTRSTLASAGLPNTRRDGNTGEPPAKVHKNNERTRAAPVRRAQTAASRLEVASWKFVIHEVSIS